jgi:general secretion pathway protein A
MYKAYFGLKENPFSIAPDPRFFFMSEGHREALAHFVYGVRSDGGFVLLTGEVGTGKTTVCRCLLEQMPKNTEIAIVLNPRLTAEELLATICDEFRISYPEGIESAHRFVKLINAYLLDLHARGRRAIVILEEAQNLSVEVLEQIRLLTNLETNQQKLLQIIMIGQPELREMLARPELRQLSQRITARYHLGALAKEEIKAYVNHRLSVAGLSRGKLFPAPTLKKLYRLTGGVPRLINVICDRALIGAFSQNKEWVDPKTLVIAAREVTGGKIHSRPNSPITGALLAGIVLLACIASATAYYYSLRDVIPEQKTMPVVSAGRGVAPAEDRTEPAIPRKALPSALLATLEKPANATRGELRDLSLKALFTLWKIHYDPKDRQPACVQALRQGLRCHEVKDSLSSLRLLNKPAVLILRDDKEGEYHALLSALKDETASVTVGSETRSVGIGEIARRWTGDFLLLWRPPAGFAAELPPGSRGEIVKWLDRRLAQAQGGAAEPTGATAYDDRLVKQVKQFQVAAGLTPDGILGWRTIVRLDDATGGSGPSLNNGKGK